MADKPYSYSFQKSEESSIGSDFDHLDLLDETESEPTTESGPKSAENDPFLEGPIDRRALCALFKDDMYLLKYRGKDKNKSIYPSPTPNDNTKWRPGSPKGLKHQTSSNEYSNDTIIEVECQENTENESLRQEVGTANNAKESIDDVKKTSNPTNCLFSKAARNKPLSSLEDILVDNVSPMEDCITAFTSASEFDNSIWSFESALREPTTKPQCMLPMADTNLQHSENNMGTCPRYTLAGAYYNDFPAYWDYSYSDTNDHTKADFITSTAGACNTAPAKTPPMFRPKESSVRIPAVKSPGSFIIPANIQLWTGGNLSSSSSSRNHHPIANEKSNMCGNEHFNDPSQRLPSREVPKLISSAESNDLGSLAQRRTSGNFPASAAAGTGTRGNISANQKDNMDDNWHSIPWYYHEQFLGSPRRNPYLERLRKLPTSGISLATDDGTGLQGNLFANQKSNTLSNENLPNTYPYQSFSYKESPKYRPSAELYIYPNKANPECCLSRKLNNFGQLGQPRISGNSIAGAINTLQCPSNNNFPPINPRYGSSNASQPQMYAKIINSSKSLSYNPNFGWSNDDKDHTLQHQKYIQRLVHQNSKMFDRLVVLEQKSKQAKTADIPTASTNLRDQRYLNVQDKSRSERKASSVFNKDKRVRFQYLEIMDPENLAVKTENPVSSRNFNLELGNKIPDHRKIKDPEKNDFCTSCSVRKPVNSNKERSLESSNAEETEPKEYIAHIRKPVNSNNERSLESSNTEETEPKEFNASNKKTVNTNNERSLESSYAEETEPKGYNAPTKEPMNSNNESSNTEETQPKEYIAPSKKFGSFGDAKQAVTQSKSDTGSFNLNQHPGYGKYKRYTLTKYDSDDISKRIHDTLWPEENISEQCSSRNYESCCNAECIDQKTGTWNSQAKSFYDSGKGKYSDALPEWYTDGESRYGATDSKIPFRYRFGSSLVQPENFHRFCSITDPSTDPFIGDHAVGFRATNTNHFPETHLDRGRGKSSQSLQEQSFDDESMYCTVGFGATGNQILHRRGRPSGQPGTYRRCYCITDPSTDSLLANHTARLRVTNKNPSPEIQLDRGRGKSSQSLQDEYADGLSTYNTGGLINFRNRASPFLAQLRNNNWCNPIPGLILDSSHDDHRLNDVDRHIAEKSGINSQVQRCKKCKKQTSEVEDYPQIGLFNIKHKQDSVKKN